MADRAPPPSGDSVLYNCGSLTDLVVTALTAFGKEGLCKCAAADIFTPLALVPADLGGARVPEPPHLRHGLPDEQRVARQRRPGH